MVKAKLPSNLLVGHTSLHESPSRDDEEAEKREGKEALGKKCSPNQVIGIVKNGISKERVAMIRQLGMGFVFDLNMSMFDHELLRWLSEHFDGNTMSIVMNGGHRLYFTEDDVYRVYGLPQGPKTVDISKITPKMCNQYYGRLLFSQDQKGTNKLTKLKKMLTYEIDDRSWLCLFVMICFGHLLEPTTANVGRLAYMRYLQDEELKDFNTYNWCAYLWTCMKKAFIRNAGAKYVDGDLHLLLIWFLDRTVRTGVLSSSIPTCKAWSYAAVVERKSAMLLQYGNFAEMPFIPLTKAVKKRDRSEDLRVVMAIKARKPKVDDVAPSTRPHGAATATVQIPDIRSMDVNEVMALRRGYLESQRGLMDLAAVLSTKIAECNNRLTALGVELPKM